MNGWKGVIGWVTVCHAVNECGLVCDVTLVNRIESTKARDSLRWLGTVRTRVALLRMHPKSYDIYV
jgi:hypothetical protein